MKPSLGIMRKIKNALCLATGAAVLLLAVSGCSLWRVDTPAEPEESKPEPSSVSDKPRVFCTRIERIDFKENALLIDIQLRKAPGTPEKELLHRKVRIFKMGRRIPSIVGFIKKIEDEHSLIIEPLEYGHDMEGRKNKELTKMKTVKIFPERHIIVTSPTRSD